MAIVKPSAGDRGDWLARLKIKTAGAAKVEMIHKGTSTDEYRVSLPVSLFLTDEELIALADGYSLANWGGNVRFAGLGPNGEKQYQVRVYND